MSENKAVDVLAVLDREMLEPMAFAARRGVDEVRIAYSKTANEECREARAAVAELLAALDAEGLGDIHNALTKSREVLSGIAGNGRKYGPIYSQANTATWQIKKALERLAAVDAALARCKDGTPD